MSIRLIIIIIEIVPPGSLVPPFRRAWKNKQTSYIGHYSYYVSSNHKKMLHITNMFKDISRHIHPACSISQQLYSGRGDPLNIKPIRLLQRIDKNKHAGIDL